MFARKPDGTWQICYDYRGLNAITRPAVEPLPHIDALLDGTRGSCFFTKLDLASSYHQLRVRAEDRWKTSFRSQLGQFEWNVVPFGLQGSSSLLMRVMNQALTVKLDYPWPWGNNSSTAPPRCNQTDLLFPQSICCSPNGVYQGLGVWPAGSGHCIHGRLPNAFTNTGPAL